MYQRKTALLGGFSLVDAKGQRPHFVRLDESRNSRRAAGGKWTVSLSLLTSRCSVFAPFRGSIPPNQKKKAPKRCFFLLVEPGRNHPLSRKNQNDDRGEEEYGGGLGEEGQSMIS